MLSVSGITKLFAGFTAVNRVSFELDSSEILGLIGPNGSGKTSLFNCITGIYRPDAGTISFAGESLLGRSPDRVTRFGRMKL